jgi:hypothetical protein
MTTEREHHTAEEKVAMLRRHFLDKVPVSDLWEELRLRPAVFLGPRDFWLEPSGKEAIIGLHLQNSLIGSDKFERVADCSSAKELLHCAVCASLLRALCFSR